MFSSFKDVLALGNAYALKSSTKLAVTPEIQELADQLTKDVIDLKKQARILYNWVSKEIRYVAIYFSDGGVVPHDATSILKNRFGDCKDHNTLLISLLKAKGIEASSAIINADNAFRVPSVGTIAPFNHVITYLPKWDLYLDSTGELYPFGVLSDALMDKPTVLAELGRIGRTPKQLPDQNKISSEIHLNVFKDGKIAGRSKTQYWGFEEISARNRYEEYTGLQKDRMVKNHLVAYRHTGTGEFIPSDVYDLNQTFELSTKFLLDPIVNLPGRGAIAVPVGLSPGRLYGYAMHQPAQETKNPFICNSRTINESYQIEFPKNVKVTQIPKNVEFNQKGIHYRAQYQQKGNQVRVLRSFVSQQPSRVCLPSEIEGFKSLLVVLRKDLRSQIFYE